METSKLIIAILVSAFFNISSAVPLWLLRPLNFKPAPAPVLGPLPIPHPPSPAPHPAIKPPSPSPSPAAPHPAPHPQPHPPIPVPAPHRANTSKTTCPIDTMKLGACVDLLGGLVHIQVGDPAIDKCCPILGGLLGFEAALCLCTTFTLRMLNMTIFLPLAIELIAVCGLTPPPGYACGDLTPKNKAAPPGPPALLSS